MFNDGYKAGTKSIQKSLVRKFLKKKRRAKIISQNPINTEPLTDKGLKLRAERRKLKRKKIR